jgi:hypothetical protein
MTGVGWLVILMGIILLGTCFLLPREIGKEDEPLSSVRLSPPSVERLAARMSRSSRPHRRSAVAPRRSPPDEPSSPEPPSAMGAPQPILTESPAGSLVLPN